jgi:RimJ/RimL family protein N-acetyltransferase
MELTLTKCAVRPFRIGDEPALARHANNRRIALNMRDRFPHPYTLDDAHAWIAHTLVETPLTNWAITTEDEVAGGIGLIRQDDVSRQSAEIGYWIGEAFWGRGIATEAVRGVSLRAFDDFDLCRVFATVFDGNAGSARVLEKAGYSFEGRMRRAILKEGVVRDALLYALVR